jgi:hypothetical protein
MAGERAASSRFFLKFVQQRLTGTKVLMPATSYAPTLVRFEKRVSLSECKSHQSIDCSDCSGEDYLNCEVYLEDLQSEYPSRNAVGREPEVSSICVMADGECVNDQES